MAQLPAAGSDSSGDPPVAPFSQPAKDAARSVANESAEQSGPALAEPTDRTSTPAGEAGPA
eukprot:7013-Alexandrium_andersonii.AAC.1